MKTFTAKTLHDNPSDVYQAAVREPVKITHKHHGVMWLVGESVLADKVQDITGLTTNPSNLDEVME